MEYKSESQSSRRKRKGRRNRSSRGRGRGVNTPNWRRHPDEEQTRPEPVTFRDAPFPPVERDTDFFGEEKVFNHPPTHRPIDKHPAAYRDPHFSGHGGLDSNFSRDYQPRGSHRGRGRRRGNRGKRGGRGRGRSRLNARADPFVPNRKMPGDANKKRNSRSRRRNNRNQGRNDNQLDDLIHGRFNRNKGRGSTVDEEEQQEEVMVLPEGPGSEQMKTMIWELKRSRYKCAICHNVVGKRAQIWSCSTCFSMFHLSCIETWAKKSRETKDVFACPKCNYVHIDFKAEYVCFCGNAQMPEFSNYQTPHSCGNPCSRLANPECSHPCTLVCHPGRCEPCNELGRLRRCSCGKTTYQLQCGETEEAPQSCKNICGKLLSCGKHRCKKTCGVHDHACEILEEQTCFCGVKTELRPCGTGELPKGVAPSEPSDPGTDEEKSDNLVNTSESSPEVKEEETESSEKPKKSEFRFRCGQPCGKQLACGNHKCTLLCGHEGSCSECMRKRTFPIKCACGQTTVKIFKYRKSCLDPLPTCDKVCGKMLACKMHLCKQKCHDSPCPPCQEKLVMKCRCKALKKKFLCSEASQQTSFLCKRKCPKVLSCGIHRCNDVCCEGRTASSWPNHTCVRFCGKMLKCGRHKCPNHCHGKRECNTCEIVLRTGIMCACGKTVIDQPILCPFAPKNLGCEHRCARTRPCGHPCPLRCHDDECPPCTVLMTKYCEKHKTRISNIHCHVEVCCGKKCGDLMRCGLHFCEKFCHKGKCFDERLTKFSSYKRSCGSVCGKKLSCGHSCKSVCHGPGKCPETECKQIGVRRCYCGHLEEQGPCVVIRKKHKMACTEACKKEQRNRNLREAWGLT